MSDQQYDVNDLFRKRTTLIGEISQNNAEHLRILQLSNGIEVALMKEHDSPETIKNKLDIESKIASSMARLDELEADLLKIDNHIEIALSKEV